MDPNEHFPASSRTTRQKTPNDSASTASRTSTSSARNPHDMAPQKPAAQPAAKGAKGAGHARPAAKVQDGDRATRTSSKDSPKTKHLKKHNEPPKPDKNEELLRIFRSDFDSLRSLVTCKICDRLLYEPYVISCGHTYCYSCLCTWFVNNRQKKTCPDCRAIVVQPPAPAYLIREMTSVFINRAELLPTGETQEQHKQWQKEEADLVQQDKTNDDSRTGGLFKGCFKVQALRPIRDEEDGVDRCPMCAWELEDGECAQCGLQFDDNGTLTWGNGFGGFSDMDETSEHDMSSEDLDVELELEDNDALDFGDYDDGMDDWQDQFDDDHSYAVRRWLANEALARPQQQAFGLGQRRRLAAHSAAGSRRRSYSASIVSDMMTEDTEMGNIEEEDEDEEDGDSSMNDFIDDGEPETGSQSAASTDNQTPTPPTNVRARRTRHVVESESSSSASQQPDEEEDDNDDDGPIAPGRRRRIQQYRSQYQPRFRRPPVAPSSSVPEDASLDQDLDEEDTQALLYEGWSPLGHDGPDDEMDEDDDSDGGRTTVGWEPTANSVDRSRIAGSLTPTADRPNVAIRPPSRVGSRFLDGSRGLRRRSSVLSAVSSAHYEDGEADDDDSDVDRDGDSSMRSNAVRPRGSRLRLRTNITGGSSRPPSSGFSSANSAENDTDENSDDTAAPGARRRPRLRAQRQEYDPRISWAFAQHMADLRDLNIQRPDAFLDHLEQLRATTPVARPRTSNRNRAAPPALVPQFSPLSNGSLPPFSPPSNAPARLRTPSNQASLVGLTSPTSPRSERSHSAASQASTSGADMAGNHARRAPSSSAASSTTITADANSEQDRSQESAQQTWALPDGGDRPLSRTNTRTPSSNSRRSSGVYSNSAYQGPISPGLNFAARFQAQQNRNPWNPFVPLSPGQMRPRQSVQRLREQSSTATLRPRNSQRGLRQQPSQVSVRDATAPAPHVRQQNSRVNLRSQPSQHRLSSQPSSRALRANNPTVMHQSNASTSSIGSNGSQRSRLTEEERLSRARELVISRQQALQGGTNPFARQVAPNQATSNGSVRSQYSASSGHSAASSSSSHSPQQPAIMATQVPNPQPTLGRRRSNRQMGAPPGAFVPPQQQHNTANAFIRARSGSVPGVSPYGPRDRAVSVGSDGITAGGNNSHY